MYENIFSLNSALKIRASGKLSICWQRAAMSAKREESLCLSVYLCGPGQLYHTFSSPAQREIFIQSDMLIPVLFKARSFPLSALQCQRSSDAVNWLMTRTPWATASSLIYTREQRWMIHGLQEGYQDILQLYALLACFFCRYTPLH